MMTNKQITDHNASIQNDNSKGPMPIISKYDNNRLSQTGTAPKDDQYYANPFLPQNI